MFEKNDERDKQFEAVWEHLLTLDRDDIIRYEDIERLTGLGRKQRGFQTIISKIRKSLPRLRGIAWECIPGVGYRLCTLNAQVGRKQEKRMKRARTEYRNGIIELMPLADAPLSKDELRARADALDYYERQNTQLRNQARHLAAIGANPPLPKGASGEGG